MGLGPVQVLPCNWSREFRSHALRIGELRHHVGQWEVRKDRFFLLKRATRLQIYFIKYDLGQKVSLCFLGF